MGNTTISKLSIAELDLAIKADPWFSLARKELFLKMSLLGSECRDEGLKRVVPYVFNMKVITRRRMPMLKENLEIEESTREEPATDKPAIDEPMIDEPTPRKSTFSFSRKVEVFRPRAEALNPEIKKLEIFKSKVEALNPEIKKVEVFKPREEGLKTNVEKVEVFKSKVEEPVLAPKVERTIHVVGGDYFTKEDFVGLENDGPTCIDRIKLNKETVKGNEYDLDMDEEDFQESKYYTETLANIYMSQGFYAKALDVYSKLILLYPKKNAYFASLMEDLKKHL